MFTKLTLSNLAKPAKTGLLYTCVFPQTSIKNENIKMQNYFFFAVTIDLAIILVSSLASCISTSKVALETSLDFLIKRNQ